MKTGQPSNLSITNVVKQLAEHHLWANNRNLVVGQALDKIRDLQLWRWIEQIIKCARLTSDELAGLLNHPIYLCLIS